MMKVLQILSQFRLLWSPETALQSSESKTEQPSKTEAAWAEKHRRQHMQKGICCCAAVEKIGQKVR